ATNYRFERKFNRSVEMRCDKRTAAIYHFRAISFKGIGGIIKVYPKQHLNEVIGQPIQNQLRFWIIDDAAAAHEATSEDTIVSFIELMPITHDVARIVRLISHHDNGGVAGHVIKATRHSTSESALSRVFHRLEGGNTVLS